MMTVTGICTMQATTTDAYRLLHEGTLALAQMESNGIRIDTDYLDKAIVETGQKIKALSEELREDEVFTKWRKRFGTKTNLGSRSQLSSVLFDVMGYPHPGWTERSQELEEGEQRTRADEEALKTVNLPFVQNYLKLCGLQKVKGTYLEGIKREVCDGVLHPSFGLNMGLFYRSNCTDPNFMNMPIRDPEKGAMVRRCFVPRKGRVLVEVDFSGIEVKISATYNHDPNLIRYIEDPTTDMHRDTAMKLFFLSKEQVDKRTTRDWSKNRFVFPQFYGSVYFQCAPHIWEAVEDERNKLPGTDIPVRKHLWQNGIRELGDCGPKGKPLPGTFVHHVQSVERMFWYDMFPTYTEWKKKWWELYQTRGWLQMHTGFICRGLMRKNQVLNAAIQGTAFHCELQFIIWLFQTLKKYKMKAKPIGEIHDSTLGDVPEKEVPDYLDICRDLITVRLRKHWSWINVPLTAEYDVAMTNWYEKKEWVNKEGKWGPKI